MRYSSVETTDYRLDISLLSSSRAVVGFRHAHGFNFGCSDIYAIVALRPLSREISHCERELSQARWMPLQEYIDSPLVHDINKHFANKFLECRQNGVFMGVTDIFHPHTKKLQPIFSLKFEKPDSE